MIGTYLNYDVAYASDEELKAIHYNIVRFLEGKRSSFGWITNMTATMELRAIKTRDAVSTELERRATK